MPFTSSQKSPQNTLEHKVAGLTIDALGRKWDPSKHPRDSRGRFIETGGIARVGLGGLGKVLRSMIGGKVEVQMRDGSHRVVPHQQLTMVRRPDGTKPTASVRKVVEQDDAREKHPQRGDGKFDADHNPDIDLPDEDPADEDDDNPDDSDHDDPEIPEVPDAYTPSRHDPRSGDLIAITAVGKDGKAHHIIGKIDHIDQGDNTKPDNITLAGGKKMRLRDVMAQAEGNGATADYTVIPFEDLNDPAALMADAADGDKFEVLDNETATDLVEGHAKATAAKSSGQPRAQAPTPGGGKRDTGTPAAPVTKDDIVMGRKPGTVEVAGRIVGRIERDPQDPTRWKVTDRHGRSKTVGQKWDTGRTELARMLNNPPQAKEKKPATAAPAPGIPEEQDRTDGTAAALRTASDSELARAVSEAEQHPTTAQIAREEQDRRQKQAQADQQPAAQPALVEAVTTEKAKAQPKALTRTKTNDGDTVNVSKSGHLFALKGTRGYSIYRHTNTEPADNHVHSLSIGDKHYEHVGDAATLEEFRLAWVGGNEDHAPTTPKVTAPEAPASRLPEGAAPQKPKTAAAAEQRDVATATLPQSAPEQSDGDNLEFRMREDKVAAYGSLIPARILEAFEGDNPEPIGHLWFDKDGGEIQSVSVQPEQQRRGVATRLFAEANRLAEEQGFDAPQHSDNLTEAGAQFVASFNEAKAPKGDAPNAPEARVETVDRNTPVSAVAKGDTIVTRGGETATVTQVLPGTDDSNTTVMFDREVPGEHGTSKMHLLDNNVPLKVRRPAKVTPEADRPNPTPDRDYAGPTTQGAPNDPLRADGTPVLGDVPAVAGRDDERPNGVLRGSGDAGAGADRVGAADAPDAAGERDAGADRGRAPRAVGADHGVGAGRSGVPAAGAGDRGPEAARDGAAGLGERPAVAAPARDKAGPSVAKNIAALRILRTIEGEGRPATAAERKVLAGWSGWGALPKVFDESDPTYAAERAELKTLLSDDEWRKARTNMLNAHYTDPALVASIWDGLKGLGFTGGDVLEPGSGSGNFIGAAPAGTHMTGVEVEPVTAGIARALHPDAEIHLESFAKSPFRPDVFDAVIGNVPFGSFSLLDRKHNRENHSIHNHFIIKSLDTLKPGGVMAVVTSSFTLDNQNDSARKAMFAQADLIGAVRLPENAHDKTAGTSVVTDVLLFRKRKDGEAPGDDSWLGTSEAKDAAGNVVTGIKRGEKDPTPQHINDYYATHGDDLLGELRSGGYNGLKVVGSGDNAAKLRDRLAAIATKARKDGRGFDADKHAGTGRLAKRDSGSTREGRISFRGVEKDAKNRDTLAFEQIEGGRKTRFEVPATQAEEFRALLELRDLYDALMEAETEATRDDDDTMQAARAALRNAYRRYVAKFGPVSRYTVATKEDGSSKTTFPPVMSKFRQDEGSAVVYGLESAFDPDTQSAKEADVLHSRQLNVARVAAQHTDDPHDAIALASERPGGLTNQTLADVLQTTPAKARQMVRGLVFNDPSQNGQMVSKAAYLSGNVRRKLEQARAAAADESSYDENVKALEAVVPADATLGDIPLQLGSAFITAEVVTQFAQALMGRASDVQVENDEGTWRVPTPKSRYGRNAQLESSTWGTDDRSFYQLLESILKGQHRIIRITRRNEDGSTWVDKKASEEAALKAQEIEQEFQDWVWANPDVGDALAAEYTLRHRSLVPRTYDDAPQRAYPGMTAHLTPRAHQNAAITRAINEPAVMFEHVVGAGKTYTLAGAAMELRRLGLARKPVLAVPGHMLAQWQAEFRELYPNAKILAADSDTLAGKDGRKRFAAMAANNDWDVVLLTHTAFESIPTSLAWEEKYLHNELDRYERQLRNAQQGGDKKREKSIQTNLEKLKKKIEERLSRRKDDDGITFESMGFDYVMADEAHVYKNLDFQTGMQGVNSPEGSGRARDMHMKLELLRSQKPTDGTQRVAAFATGTPISNSLAEMYTMTRFMRPDLLDEAGVGDFDSWAATFATVSAKVEQDTSANGWVERVRMRGFTDALGDALRIWRTFSDTKTAKDLNLPRPTLKGGARQIHAVEPSDAQMEALASFKERVETLPPGRAQKGDDTHVAIIGDGRRAAIDPRLMSERGLDRSGIDRDDEDMESPKIQEAAAKILGIWNERKNDRFKVDHKSDEDAELAGALQMVMIDSDAPKKGKRSSYQMLKDALVAGGMPADQIRFVQEAAGSSEKKAKLFDDARQGRVAVLMGSTASLGTGTNVQNRLYALHHIDGSWKPSDIEQREGRILRQGNQYAEVEIHAYVTKRTHDVKTWDMTAYKQAALDAIAHGSFDMKAVEFADDVDPLTDYDTITGLASGDPLVQDRRDLAPELKRLRNAERSHRRQIDRAKGVVAQTKRTMDVLRTRRGKLTDALARRRDISGDNFAMTLNAPGGYRPLPLGNRKDAAEALRRLAQHHLEADYMPPGRHPQTIVGNIGGLDIRLSTINESGAKRQIALELTTSNYYADPLPLAAVTIGEEEARHNIEGVLTRLENRVNGIENAIAKIDTDVARQTEELGAAEEATTRRFRFAGDLADAERREQLLDKLLTGNVDKESGESMGLLREEYAEVAERSKSAGERAKIERMNALKAEANKAPEPEPLKVTPEEQADADEQLAAEVAKATPAEPKPTAPKATDETPAADTMTIAPADLPTLDSDGGDDEPPSAPPAPSTPDEPQDGLGEPDPTTPVSSDEHSDDAGLDLPVFDLDVEYDHESDGDIQADAHAASKVPAAEDDYADRRSPQAPEDLAAYVATLPEWNDQLDDDPVWMRPVTDYGFQSVLDANGNDTVESSKVRTSADEYRGVGIPDAVELDAAKIKYAGQPVLNIGILNDYVGDRDTLVDDEPWFGTPDPVVTPWKDGYLILDGTHRVASDRLAGRTARVHVVPNDVYPEVSKPEDTVTVAPADLPTVDDQSDDLPAFGQKITLTDGRTLTFDQDSFAGMTARDEDGTLVTLDPADMEGWKPYAAPKPQADTALDGLDVPEAQGDRTPASPKPTADRPPAASVAPSRQDGLDFTDVESTPDAPTIGDAIAEQEAEPDFGNYIGELDNLADAPSAEVVSPTRLELDRLRAVNDAVGRLNEHFSHLVGSRDVVAISAAMKQAYPDLPFHAAVRAVAEHAVAQGYDVEGVYALLRKAAGLPHLDLAEASKPASQVHDTDDDSLTEDNSSPLSAISMGSTLADGSPAPSLDEPARDPANYDEHGMGKISRGPGYMHIETALGDAEIHQIDGNGAWMLTYPGSNAADDAYPTRKDALKALRGWMTENYGTATPATDEAPDDRIGGHDLTPGDRIMVGDKPATVTDVRGDADGYKKVTIDTVTSDGEPHERVISVDKSMRFEPVNEEDAAAGALPGQQPRTAQESAPEWESESRQKLAAITKALGPKMDGNRRAVQAAEAIADVGAPQAYDGPITTLQEADAAYRDGEFADWLTGATPEQVNDLWNKVRDDFTGSVTTGHAHGWLKRNWRNLVGSPEPTPEAGSPEAVEKARASAEQHALETGATKKAAKEAGEHAAADEATASADKIGETPIAPAPPGGEAQVAEPKTPTQLPDEKHPLTRQQQTIADSVVADRENVVVEAGAGAGKTSTLEAIARRFQLLHPKEQIAYVAFNKTVQTEAEGRMPGNVEPRTGHSIAWAWAGRDFTKKRDNRNALRRADEIARFLGITQPMKSDDGTTLTPAEQAQAALGAVDAWSNSADDKIGVAHLPERFRDLPDTAQKQLVKRAEDAWADLTDKDGQIKVSFDHIRKMWALSKPDLGKPGSGLAKPATVLFLDEAQDTPPVLAKVIEDQTMQKVIVGDTNQAIYGFTGAVDYLKKAAARVRLPLTKSWRFGPQVADMGNRFLEVLGAKERIEGGGADSKIVQGMDAPDAILVRSNGGMIGEILREQEAGRTVGVPKGTKADLISLAESARYLMGEGGAPDRMHEDLAPYRTWAEVQEAADKGDDPKLAMLTRIVRDYGVDRLEQIVRDVHELSDGGLTGVRFEQHDHGLVATGKGTFDNREVLKDAGFRWMEVPGGGVYTAGKNKGQPMKAWTATGTPEQQQATLDKAKAAAAGVQPDVVVSTAHKAKGLEWGRVRIGDDFRGPEEDKATGEMRMPSPEELKLAYVAVTRAEKELDLGSLAWVLGYSHPNGDAGRNDDAAPEAEVVETVPVAPADLPAVDAPEVTGEPARSKYGFDLDMSDEDLDAAIDQWQDHYDNDGGTQFSGARLDTLLAERQSRSGEALPDADEDDAHDDGDLALDPSDDAETRARKRRKRDRRKRYDPNPNGGDLNNGGGGPGGGPVGAVVPMGELPLDGDADPAGSGAAAPSPTGAAADVWRERFNALPDETLHMAINDLTRSLQETNATGPDAETMRRLMTDRIAIAREILAERHGANAPSETVKVGPNGGRMVTAGDLNAYDTVMLDGKPFQIESIGEAYGSDRGRRFTMMPLSGGYPIGRIETWADDHSVEREIDTTDAPAVAEAPAYAASGEVAFEDWNDGNPYNKPALGRVPVSPGLAAELAYYLENGETDGNDQGYTLSANQKFIVVHDKDRAFSALDAIEDIKLDQARDGNRGALALAKAAGARKQMVRDLPDAASEQTQGTAPGGWAKVDPANLNVGDVIEGTMASTGEKGHLTVESAEPQGSMILVTGTNSDGVRDFVRVPAGHDTELVGSRADDGTLESAWGRNAPAAEQDAETGPTLPENLSSGDVINAKAGGRQGRWQLVRMLANNNPLFDRWAVVPEGRPDAEPVAINLAKKRPVTVVKRGDTPGAAEPVDANGFAEGELPEGAVPASAAELDELFGRTTPEATAPEVDADVDTRPEPLINGHLPNPQGLTLPADLSGDYSPEQIEFLSNYAPTQVVANIGDKWHVGDFEGVKDGSYVFRPTASMAEDDVLHVAPEDLHEVRGIRAAEGLAEEVDPSVLRPGTRVAFTRDRKQRVGVLEGITADGRAQVRDIHGDVHETVQGGRVRPVLGGYLPGAEPADEAFAPKVGVWTPNGDGQVAGVPGEWVAGIVPAGDGYHWELNGAPGSGFAAATGDAPTVEAAREAVVDALYKAAGEGAGVTTLPGDDENDRDSRTRELGDTLAELRGDETTAGEQLADETATAPDVDGATAGWVPTGDLQPGDIARVDGDNGNGSATTRTGHVLGTPEPTEVHSPTGGKPAKATRTPIGPDRDGLGDRETILSPEESVAARVERPDEYGDADNPADAAESQVLTGRVGDTMPTDANGLGVFPGSVVTDGRDRHGVVTEVWDLDAGVRWAGKDHDERIRPGLLHVDPAQQSRPDGWTASGRKVAADQMVTIDGGDPARVASVSGDDVEVETLDGEHRTVSAGAVKVVGTVRDDHDAQAEEYAAPAFDAPPSVEGLDVRPAAPVKPEPLDQDTSKVVPNLNDDDRQTLGELGIDADATSPMQVQQAAARLGHGMPISVEQATDLSAWLGALLGSKGVPAGRARKVKRLRNRIDAANTRAGGNQLEARPTSGVPQPIAAGDVVRGDVIAVPNPATGEAAAGTVRGVWRIQNGQVVVATVEHADGTWSTHHLNPDGEVFLLPDLDSLDKAPEAAAPANIIEEDRPFTQPRVSTRLEDAAQAVTDAALDDDGEVSDLDTLAADVTGRLDAGDDAREQHNASRRLETSLEGAGIDPESAQAAHDAAEHAADRVAEQVADMVRETVTDAEPLPGESESDAASRVRDRLREVADEVAYDAAAAAAIDRASAIEEGTPAIEPTRAEQAHAEREIADALRADLFAMADQLAALGDTENANALSDVAARLAGRPDEVHVQRAIAAASMGRGPSKVRSLAARIRGMFARARARFVARVQAILEQGRRARRSWKAAVTAARTEWNGTPEVGELVADAARHLADGGDPEIPDVATVEPAGFAERLTYWGEQLPTESGMFGRRDASRRGFRGLTLDRLRSGKQVEADELTGSVLDRAADGGPGATALAHHEAVSGVGAAVRDEMNARIRGMLPEFGHDPAGAVREAAAYAERIAREERGDLSDDELTKVRRKARAEALMAAKLYADARAEALAGVLAQVRPMGPQGAATINVQGRAGDAPEVAALRWAEKHVPTDWLAAAGTVEVKAGRMGSYGEDGTITVAPLAEGLVDGAGRYGASALHGLAHHLETTVPGLAEAAWVHHWKATSAGEPGSRNRRGPNGVSWLSDLFPGAGFDRTDGTARGARWDGSEFDQEHYEWVPTAFEQLFAGAAGNLDDDLEAFMLGLLGWLGRNR